MKVILPFTNLKIPSVEGVVPHCWRGNPPSLQLKIRHLSYTHLAGGGAGKTSIFKKK